MRCECQSYIHGIDSSDGVFTCVEADKQRFERLQFGFPDCDGALRDAAHVGGLRVHGHVEAVEEALELVRGEQVGPVVGIEGGFATRVAVLHEGRRKACAC